MLLVLLFSTYIMQPNLNLCLQPRGGGGRLSFLLSGPPKSSRVPCTQARNSPAYQQQMQNLPECQEKGVCNFLH